MSLASSSRKRILVPRWMDRENVNPQNTNAQNILARIPRGAFDALAFNFHQPRADVRSNPAIELIQLWRSRLWRLRAGLAYLQRLDAIFYPGPEFHDAAGILLRDISGRRVPVVATLEGLVGDEAREKEYSTWAGHQVYCQRVSPEVLSRLDWMYRRADHVIAISPFLARMGARRFGEKFSVLPLGVDLSVFFPAQSTPTNRRPRIVAAGNFQPNKRPELFLDLARRHRDADFVWYGQGGPRRLELSRRAELDNISNVSFPGACSQVELAEAFRQADVFVMPSQSEGVPKVTQEAAACGLPAVLFGYYEAPSVLDEVNGFVVWNDEDFFARVAELIGSPELRARMRGAAIDLAREWDWDRVACSWHQWIDAAISGSRA